VKPSVKIYVSKNVSTHNRTARWMQVGLARHGINAPISTTRHYEPTDLAVFWNHRSTRRHIMDGQRERGADYLVMENGYINGTNGDYRTRRMANISLGYNGLNGRADFHNACSPPDRWRKLGVALAPWKSGGDYILILGQVPGDESLAQCPDLFKFYRDLADRLRATFPDLPVRFRPHPLARQYDWQKLGLEHFKSKGDDQASLADQLNRAAAAAGWNSNALVDAVISGVPIIANDVGSMAWPVAADANCPCIYEPDRRQWAWNLAYTQWTPAEIEDGTAWDHLKVRYENPNCYSAAG
jgi:hypothetical protein